MKEAFIYMFRDKKWWMKLVPYALIVFFTNLLMDFSHYLRPACPKCQTMENMLLTNGLYLFGVILNCIALGYVFSCIKKLIDESENHELPFLNPWRNLLKGLKCVVSFSMLLLPLAFIYMLCGHFFKWNAFYMDEKGIISFIIINVIILILSIGFGILLPAFNWLFAKEGSFLNFYKFRKIFHIISLGKKQYFIGFGFILIFILINALIGFTTDLFIEWMRPPITADIVINAVMAALIGGYAALGMSYVMAKCITDNKEEEQA